MTSVRYIARASTRTIAPTSEETIASRSVAIYSVTLRPRVSGSQILVVAPMSGAPASIATAAPKPCVCAINPTRNGATAERGDVTARRMMIPGRTGERT